MNRHESKGASSLSVRTFVFSLLISFLAVLTAHAEAGPRWVVTLTDDSRIVVTPGCRVLRLESDLLDAAISIPVSAIRKVEPNGEQGVTVDLANGDRISGRLAGDALAARALFGRIDIPPKHIRRIEVTDAAESVDLENPAAATDRAIVTLRSLFQELSARPAVPERWDGTIRYCTGENHSDHGILVHGFSYDKPDDRPPTDGRPYACFYYDSGGRVRLVVRHIPGQAPYVSDYIAYHENRPLARISYSREAVAYGDFIHYVKGIPSLSCRILSDGRAVLVKKLSED